MTRVFLCLLLALSVLNSRAELVPFNTAQQLAYSVMAQGGQTRTAKKLVLITDGETNSTRAVSDPAYYLFGSEDGKGFVLVSGDSRCKAILGYSYNNPYSLEDLPANLKWYLDGIKQIINESRSVNAPSEKTSRAWTGQQNLKEELYYETAQWNQDKLYASDCPLGKYAGSVPTALAIIMRYHNWPEFGVGTAPAYTTNTSKISVESRNLLHTYRWSKMPLIPKETADYVEISKLLADIGIVLKADYGYDLTGSSTSYLPNVVYMNFRFKNGSQILSHKEFDRFRWTQMLQTELQQTGPVLLEGGNNAFVVHGYNSDKMFAVNWGWGGKMNGFFELSPGTDSDYYIKSTRGFFGLRKVDSDVPVDGLPKLYMSPVLDKVFKYVEADKKVYFMAKTLQNTDYTTMVRLVVADGSGKVMQVLNEKSIKFSTWVIYYNSIEFNEPIRDIKPGYHLEVQYRNDSLGLWMPIEHGDKEQWQIPLTNELPILENTSFYFDREKRIITLTVSNSICVEFLGTNGVLATNTQYESDNVIKLNLSNVARGSYILRLSNEYETKDIAIKL